MVGCERMSMQASPEDSSVCLVFRPYAPLVHGAAGQSMQSHLHGGQDSLRGGAASVRLVLDMHGVARPPPLTEPPLLTCLTLLCPSWAAYCVPVSLRFVNRLCYIYFTLLFWVSSPVTVRINSTNKMNAWLLRRSYKGTYFSLAGKEEKKTMHTCTTE